MAQISWQLDVATAGTAVAGPNTGPGTFLIRAHTGNSGTNIYFGNDGADDVSSTTGFALGSGEFLIVTVTNLNQHYFDVDTNGDDVMILKIVGEGQGVYPPV